MRSSFAVLAVLVTAFVVGCEEEPPPQKAAPKPTASAPAKASAAAPAPTAEAPKNREDCPEGSAGPGTSDKPCDAKGTDRMIEVTWTGKKDDKGPTFRIVSKSKLPILYGTVVAYFYDKSGKQLAVAGGGEARQKQTCSGRIFGGVVKPGEKWTVTFSCVKNDHVPADAVAIEAEVMTAGFSDAEGSKTEFYWRNESLAPDVRPKGGSKDKQK
jgi:hypothetical protein